MSVFFPRFSFPSSSPFYVNWFSSREYRGYITSAFGTRVDLVASSYCRGQKPRQSSLVDYIWIDSIRFGSLFFFFLDRISSIVMDVLSFICEKWSRERKENRLESTSHRAIHSSSSTDVVRSNLFSVCLFPADRWKFCCSSFCLAILQSIHQPALSHPTHTRTAGASMKAKKRLDEGFLSRQSILTLLLTYVFLSHPNE